MAMTAREAQRHIGERVLYTSPVTRQMSGFGVIVSADERWIHVLYPGSGEPIKTHPDNLTLDRSAR